MSTHVVRHSAGSMRNTTPLVAPLGEFGNNAGNSTLRVAIVRDPNNLFVVLIEAPPAG